MPSNKTSLYDGSVTIIGGSLDLTGQVGLADGAITNGYATITVDNGTYDWVVGNEVYGCESSGEGDINFDLKVVFVNSSSILSKPVFPFSIPLIAFCNDSAKLLPIAITSPTDFI